MQNLYPKSKIAGGEPMLSKRNLYPSLNTPETWRKLDGSEADQRSQLNTIFKDNVFGQMEVKVLKTLCVF